MTTIKGIKRFFAPTARRGLMAVACLMAGGALADGFDGMTLVTNNWFAADFTAQTAGTVITQGSTTGISSGAGSWTAVPATGTAQIVADADAGGEATRLSINAEEGELTFTPAALATATGMATVAVDVKTIAVDTLPTPKGGAQGAFAIYSPDGEAHSLAAYVSDGTAGVWTNLVYASAANLTNVWFTLTLDFATVENVRYVRYSITPSAGSLTILADTAGTQWFPSADDDATTVASVSFTGTGNIRTFSGDSLAEPVATCNGENYATVADAIAAAEEGGTVTLVKTMSSENIAVTKDVTINGGGNSNYQLNVSSLEIATGKTITFNNFAAQNTIGAITGGGNIATSGNRTFRLKISGSNYTFGGIALGTTQGIRVEGEGTIAVSNLSATASSVLDAYDGAQITIGEVASDSDITVSLKLVNTAAMTKRGSGTLTFAGVAAPTAGFVVEGGSVIIDNSMDGVSPYVWVDASDASTITETDGKVTEWASLVNRHSYTNEASAMTYVAAEGVFGGKKVVRTNNSQLQAEFTGDKVQSAVAAIRYYSNSSTGGILYTKNARNNYIGKRNAGHTYWSCLRTSSTACSLWQNGGTSDISFSTYETVLTVAEYYNGSATIEQLGGASGDIAIAEFIGFNTTDTGCPVRKRTEAYLGNKWSISGMVSLPSSVPLTLAGGTTFGLKGLDRTVDSVTITGTGTATVTGGALTITAPVSVSVGQTLVIPYGSTYKLADDGTYAVVDSVGGTVTLTHRAADIDGTPYDTVQGAVDAYELGTLTIHESATIDLGTTDVNISGIALDDGVELTLTQNAPWTTTFSEGNLVNTRVASTYVWTPGENETTWSTLSNWRIGEATPVALPGSSDTVSFPALEESEDSWEVSVPAGVEVAGVVVNGATTFAGSVTYTDNSKFNENALIYTPSVTGSATVTLGNNAGFGVKSNGASMNISVPIVVTANDNSPAAISGLIYDGKTIDSASTLTVSGAITGSGKICFAGVRMTCTVSGSMATFSGTVKVVGDGLERNNTIFADVSSTAVYDITNNSGNDNSFISSESADAARDLTFKELKGAPNFSKIYGNTTYTWSVGSGNSDFTLGGVYHYTADTYSYNDTLLNGGIVIKKVGDGEMEFKGSWEHGLEVNEGTLFLSKVGSLSQKTRNYTYLPFIKFTGGTLKLDESVTLDVSTNIAKVASTSAIAFDDEGIDRTWEVALPGTGGLTKKGSGKLTLSAAPGYTGTTTVEAGTLVVTNGTSAWEYTLGADTKASLAMDGDIYVYTLTPLTSKEKPEAVEGVIKVPESMDGVSAVYAITPGESIDCSLLTTDASGIKAVVTTTVGGETVDATSYYKPNSLTVNGGTTIVPELADSVKPTVVTDGSDAPMELTTSTVSFNVSNFKKGLYYGISVGTSPDGLKREAALEQATDDSGTGVDLSSGMPDIGVKYYRIVVSDVPLAAE